MTGAGVLTSRSRQRWRTSPVPLPWITALAGLAGVATGVGFAPAGWWAATLLGISCLAVAVRQATTLHGAVTVGFAYGLGLTTPTLNWMAVIDPGAAVGLILVQSGWYALLGGMLRWAGRSRGWPLVSAGTWVAVEYAASRAPFGGFGWLRLGYAMVDSPLAGLLPLTGVAGVTFAASVAANVLVWAADRPSLRRLAGTVGVALVLSAGTTFGASIPPAPAEGTVSVGWAQGGAPGGGVYGLGPPRTITTNQARATLDLAADVAAGRQRRPDFVVWPENSTDLDPAHDLATGELVSTALAAVGRPILVGAILDGPGPDQRRTAAQWRTPDGQVGPTYVKRSIVPFGEWIPYRDLLLPLVPALGYVGAQSVAGTEPGLLKVRLSDGRAVTLGVLACFDVAFDPVVYDLADAQVLIVQSSNAMYQGTAQIEQQFAITRARAAELRREVLVVTTSGISGVIDPNGGVRTRAAGPGPASGVVDLPLRSGTTPATRISGAAESGVTLATMVWLAALPLQRRHQLVRS